MFNHDELLNLMNSVQMSLCLSNLLLTGNATPYLHNGTLQIEDLMTKNGEFMTETPSDF